MDSGSHKLYHVHDFDSRRHLETYFSDKPENIFGDDSLKFPMEKLYHKFKEGHIKGDVLIDISGASFVHHLYSACEYFKDIYLLKFNEKCIMEMNKWRHTRTGAFDWYHTSTYATELEGNSNQWEDKEMRLKTALKQTVKCNIEKENLTYPVILPPADCVISVFLLEAISKDQDDHIRNFRKFTKLLKPGGHMILVGVINATYIMIGPDKFHLLKCDEDFIRKVLIGEGFIIDNCDILKRNASSDLTDYEAIYFLTAHKEK